MTKLKNIIFEDEIVDRVMKHTENFSEAVRDALEKWLAIKEGSEAFKAKKIEILQETAETIEYLEETKEKNDKIEAIKAWIEIQPRKEALLGKIYELAEKEQKSWEFVAEEYMIGKRVSW